TDEPHVEREMVLIKVSADSANRGEIIQIVEVFRSRVVDVAPRTLTVEMTGDEGKITALVSMLRPYGVVDVVRTGKVAIGRGNHAVVSESAGDSVAAG
ncbi:acetolactate synthase small subunit, partial [Candidatus Poribacteria bacterium]|nr:acetolactate synthase small subunit [Candidatus Poribacteria bacterium]